MKHIYSYWKEVSTKNHTEKEGYSVADITFHFDACDESGNDLIFGKDRKTLKAAINDAKRFFKKRNNDTDYYGIYANAVLTDYYDDGSVARKPSEDCARIGSLDPNGQYFDMCEDVDWLEEA